MITDSKCEETKQDNFYFHFFLFNTCLQICVFKITYLQSTAIFTDGYKIEYL